jgi:hypothetical protein
MVPPLPAQERPDPNPSEIKDRPVVPEEESRDAPPAVQDPADRDVTERENGERTNRRTLRERRNDRAALGVNVADTGGRGLRIDRILPRGPAAKAGLRRGDQILAVDNAPIRNFRNLVAAIRTKQPGEKARFTIIRNGVEQFVDVVLESVEEAWEENEDRDDDVGPPRMDHDQIVRTLRDLERDLQVLAREIRMLKDMLEIDPDSAVEGGISDARPSSDSDIQNR